MLKSVARLGEMCERQGELVVQTGDTCWLRYQRAVVPIGPVKFDYSISEKEEAYLLGRFRGSVMVLYTRGFTERESSWYALIADRSLQLEQIGKKTRYDIRYGLARSSVQRVDAELVAREGYETYRAAFGHYKGRVSPMPQDEFQRRISTTGGLDDVVHYFAVFVGGRVAGWSVAWVYEDIEANYSMTKLHPDFRKVHAGYALRYEMDRYYLGERRVGVVNSGFRSILHETRNQDWLVTKFGYQRRGVGLRIAYRAAVRGMVALAYPLRGLLGALDPRLRALLTLEGIRRECEGRP